MIALALVWAVVLLPEAFDLVRRRSLTGSDSISSFNQRLAVLERTSGAGAVTLSEISNVVPLRGAAAPEMARSGDLADPVRTPASSPAGNRGADAARIPVRRRRAQVLGVLGAMTLMTFLLALTAGLVGLVIFALVAGAMVSYVVALVGVARRERMMRQVAPLRSRPAAGASVRPIAQPRRAIAN